MTKEELKNHITRYKNVENIVYELDTKYGINIFNSRISNFYNEYNYIIHNLLVSIFGNEKTDIIEEYCFEQNDLTFDELCRILNIE